MSHTKLTEEIRSATAWAKPSCIFQPSNEAELQRAIQVLTSQDVMFAICSGGHSPSPLAANISNGILIDMSLFDTLSYDAAANVAIVGAGQRWANVYAHLDQGNVTVVGGRVLDVGVGGLTQGGKILFT